MNNDSLPLDLHHESAASAQEAARLIARLVAGPRLPARDEQGAGRAAARLQLLQQAAASVMTQSGGGLPANVLALLR
ncbi:hypothetical protein [uncultured Massilia sp.]|uniref:hypothetical protein n=1 Tax=uncultured Massilia sp. TaxID=169973 RepID=UPI0025D1AB57|nr:hypothetical protein [uncultured Massilia sp.]